MTKITLQSALQNIEGLNFRIGETVHNRKNGVGVELDFNNIHITITSTCEFQLVSRVHETVSLCMRNNNNKHIRNAQKNYLMCNEILYQINKIKGSRLTPLK